LGYHPLIAIVVLKYLTVSRKAKRGNSKVGLDLKISIRVMGRFWFLVLFFHFGGPTRKPHFCFRVADSWPAREHHFVYLGRNNNSSSSLWCKSQSHPRNETVKKFLQQNRVDMIRGGVHDYDGAVVETTAQKLDRKFDLQTNFNPTENRATR
jgi:hypothetical protein